jgi:hypothetical protein
MSGDGTKVGQALERLLGRTVSFVIRRRRRDV